MIIYAFVTRTGFKKDTKVVGDLMITLAALIVRNEFCQEVEDAGGLKFILDIMTDYPDSEKLNWQALKLLKALAGNDNVKSHIVTSGCAPLIVSAISRMKVNLYVINKRNNLFFSRINPFPEIFFYRTVKQVVFKTSFH